MKKGITKRWLVNGLGITVLLLLVVSVTFLVAMRVWFLNQVETEISSQVKILASQFEMLNSSKELNYEQSCKDFVQNYSDKKRVELMMLDSNGYPLVTSSGFQVGEKNKVSDYFQAIKKSDGFFLFTNNNYNGQQIMGVTKVLTYNNTNIGAVRLLVSLDKINSNMIIITLTTCVIVLFIIFFVVASGMYFINSIVKPVQSISQIAGHISQGNFKIRLEKTYDDEIGQLCDSINNMANELASNEQMKNDFISSVSHELRTPLTAITGWAETMKLIDINEDRQTYEKGIDVIEKEAKRLTGIVEELLDFSRIQSGRMTVNMDKIDLLAEIEDAVYVMKERARKDKITVQYDDPELFLPVVGDRNRLRQVFINILENAIKYSFEGGYVNVNVIKNVNNVVIEVVDFGCGIDEKDLPKVKEKFYKANNTKSGSGIGLAIADEIINLHNGKLEIESKAKRGCKVTITLPLILN